MSKWEKITRKNNGRAGYETCKRMKIAGGWLVKNVRVDYTAAFWDKETRSSSGICFVPDPEYKWELDSE